MLSAGSRMPDLTLFGADAEPVRLRSLAPVVLAFYLFDWTGT
jgi:peroxiredoxin